MHYVLILFIMGNYSMTTNVIEFNTQQACEATAAIEEAAIKKLDLSVSATCHSKGIY